MTPTELKTLRTSAGLSQHQLALLLGVTRGAVDHWESGRRGISTVTAIAIETVTKGKTMTVKQIKEDAVDTRTFSNLGVSIYILPGHRFFNIEAEPLPTEITPDNIGGLLSDINYWILEGNDEPYRYSDEIAELRELLGM